MALVVFTGGARSGKSTAAEKLALTRVADGQAVAVVVFGRAAEADPEFAARIARHRADRPAAFSTIEAADSLCWREQVAADDVVLLDCVGTLLGRAMEEAWDECARGAMLDAAAESLPDGFEAVVSRRFDEAVEWLCSRDGDTIVVTNEVGDGVIPSYATGRVFRDLLGRANRRLVSSADAAYLAVAGRLVDIGSLSSEAHWPQD